MPISEKQYNSIPEGIGEIISKISIIHFLAAQIISYYYLKNDSSYKISFFNDILTNEKSTFSFITNSLKRILLNLNFDKTFVNKIEGKMIRLGNLRNKFAHEMLLYNKNTLWFPDRKSIPWKGEGLNFEVEFNNFNNLYNEIKTELDKIIKDKRIKIINYIPNDYNPPTE